ncbi:MAG: mannose-1-phosphate guanylyltransferase [Planctomycetaceae bacterium]|nr:mannose-1-phosphate guanylyltransferase [Planctomycetaceae bacterium]
MKHAVIMAGGSGTRFWPQSRETFPKQFLTLSGERSLIQSTFDRCQPDIAAKQFWVVTNAVQADATRQQLPEIPASHIIEEPCGRNTAPCIGLAAIQLLASDPDAVMVVMPADHIISPSEKFRQAIEQATRLIETDPGRLVLFGVRPTYPATGFGYIEQGSPLSTDEPGTQVASFREKPDAATAQEYVESGRFFWNCGIFVWRAETILDCLKQFEPDIHAQLQLLVPTVGTDEWSVALAEQFPQMKSISIDHGVLERADNICLLEAPYTWDDVGSWHALERLHPQDEHGNTVVNLHCGVDTSGCIIRGEKEHLIATLGVRDLIIVHTQDATFVASKHDENAIRQLIQKLRESGYEQYL